MPGIQELLIIAGIMLLIFGGKKVPELMGGLGKGIKEFKRGILWTKEDDKVHAELQGEGPPETYSSKKTGPDGHNA